MGRGFLGGIFIGGVVSIAAAVVLAIIVEPPRPPQFDTDIVTEVLEDAPALVDSEVGRVPQPDSTQETAAAAPDVAPLEREDGEAVDQTAATSVPRPETVIVTGDSPDVTDLPPDAGVNVSPVQPADAPMALTGPALKAAPGPEQMARVETAAPPRAQVSADTATDWSVGSDSDLPDAASPSLAPIDEAAGLPSSPPGVPQQPATEPTAPPEVVASARAVPNLTDVAPSGDTPAPVASSAATVLPAAASADDALTPATAPAAPDTSPVDDVLPSPEVRDPGEQIVSLPEANTGLSRPTIGRPATSLLTRRAPSQVAAATDVAVGETALAEHSEPFENPDEKPLLSIVLMDMGQDLEAEAIGLPALRSFPYDLSIAVDASRPDAAERAAQFRSQGLEVLALIDLPESLTAADTEVALATLLENVPGAVGVLEGFGTGLQGSTEMADQVGAILHDTGHGIIWQPKGLDTARKLAARRGVASHTLFRDFDGKDQKPVVIRRFLDQASFKAGQEGSVIMVGRLRADTIAALLVWGLQDRALRVGIAPVSAVLREPQEDS